MSKEGLGFISDLLLSFILFLFHGVKKKNTLEDFLSNSHYQKSLSK